LQSHDLSFFGTVGSLLISMLSMGQESNTKHGLISYDLTEGKTNLANHIVKFLLGFN